ncbi:MAG: ATP synthase F1 subunit delta [Ruminococcaceae bacterium]|nr:ATP synthase F1 subunit delta [Oscillospiraceae bacterium]
MKDTSKAYAEALFAIAMEKNKVQEYAQQLETIEEVLKETPQYPMYLTTPALPLSERLLAIDEAFGKELSEDVVSLLKLLCENNYITKLSEIIKEFFKLEMAVSNTITVTITSKIPLAEEQKEKLIKKLEDKYRKHICPIYQIDETLIGGFTITAEDQMIDGSVQKRLQRMKEVMKL